MIKVDLEFDEKTLKALQDSMVHLMDRKIAPVTAQAFEAVSQMIQESWRSWAMGSELPGAQSIKPNARLAHSIKITRNSDWHHTIGTDSPIMERIQEGQSEFDMKKTHPYGKKSRVSKKGVPYLIIPFRWGTPSKQGGRAHFGNTIPKIAYAILKSKEFKKSTVQEGTITEPNAQGEGIERATYSWGDRIKDSSLGNASGMVRMESAGKSTYFTFRVISAKSPSSSWVRKAVPANDVVSAIEKNVQKAANEIIQAGLEADFG